MDAIDARLLATFGRTLAALPGDSLTKAFGGLREGRAVAALQREIAFVLGDVGAGQPIKSKADGSGHYTSIPLVVGGRYRPSDHLSVQDHDRPVSLRLRAYKNANTRARRTPGM
jgi:hypothetical protein